MSKHGSMSSIEVMVRNLALLVSLGLLAACTISMDSSLQVTPTKVDTLSPDTARDDKTTPVPELSSTPTPIGAGESDCASVTEIPTEECTALATLYNGTNGQGWADNGGWLAANRPCSWTGITCTGDHVSEISLTYNQLTGPLPPALGNLTHLRVVELGANQLFELAPNRYGVLETVAASFYEQFESTAIFIFYNFCLG